MQQANVDIEIKAFLIRSLHFKAMERSHPKNTAGAKDF